MIQTSKERLLELFHLHGAFVFLIVAGSDSCWLFLNNTNGSFVCVVITRPRDMLWPRQARDGLSRIPNTEIIKCETESELLEELLALMQKADPDLIIGYDCAFQFDVLMQRMFALKVPNWNRMGRLKSTIPPVLRVRVYLPYLRFFEQIHVRSNNKIKLILNWKIET